MHLLSFCAKPAKNGLDEDLNSKIPEYDEARIVWKETDKSFGQDQLLGSIREPIIFRNQKKQYWVF